MANETYDLVVIGAGPGGYVAAIRAAQLGMKVACVEKNATLGGTCLNVGCIPSKALLQSSHLFEETRPRPRRSTASWSAAPKLDLAQMMKRKGEVVGATTKGIEFLFKKNKIAWLQGTGRIEAAGKVAVIGPDGAVKDTVDGQEHPDRHRLGSDAAARRRHRREEDRVLDRRARARPRCPKHLVVIGAGIIGLELGSVWRRLGAEVTVVEFLDRIVPGMDDEIAKHFQRALAKQGLKFKLGSKVTKAETSERRRHAHGRAGQRRRGRDAAGRRRAGGDRPPSLRRGPRPRQGGRQARPSAAASPSTRISRPPCPASTPSAT